MANAVRSGVIIGVGSTFIVGGAAPGVGFTGHRRFYSVLRAVPNGQDKCFRTGTTMGVSVMMGIGAALSVSLPVPSIGIIGRFIKDVMRTLINGQLQCFCAGTALLVGVFAGVGAALRVRLSVPSVRFTGFCCDNIVCALMDGEVKGDHAVASVGSGKRHRIVAALRIVGSVPGVRVAGRGTDGAAGGGVYRHRYRSTVNTTFAVGAHDGVGGSSGRADRNAGGVTSIAPIIAAGLRSRKGGAFAAAKNGASADTDMVGTAV